MHEREYSDETAKIIDDEVENLITEAIRRATAVIRHNREKLEDLKNKLLEKETIEGEEVLVILKDTVLPKAAQLY